MSLKSLQKQTRKFAIILMLVLVSFGFFPFSSNSVNAAGTCDLTQLQASNPRGDSDIAKFAFSPPNNQILFNTKQKFQVGIKVQFSNPEVGQACQNANLKFDFVVSIPMLSLNKRVSTPMVPVNYENGNYGLTAKLPPMTLGDLGLQGLPQPDKTTGLSPEVSFKLLITDPANSQNTYQITNSDKNTKLSYTLSEQGEPASFVELDDETGVAGQYTISDMNTTNSLQSFIVTIKPNSEGKGLRSKYRVLSTDSELAFGAKDASGNPAGPDPVYAIWGVRDFNIRKGDYFTLPANSDGWFAYDTTPQYQGIFASISQSDAVKSDQQCDPKLASKGCQGALFITGTNGDKGKESSLLENLNPDGTSAFNPTLFKAGWANKISSQTVAEGAPVATVKYRIVPVVLGANNPVSFAGALGAWLSQPGVLLLLGTTKAEFTVEVYDKMEDITKACQADLKSAGKSAEEIKKCDDTIFAKYGFADPISVTTGTSQQGEDSALDSFYKFLIMIIAYLVVLITGLLYLIFSTIFLPILNALVKVHPYQDAFVNLIYPGWLILRNLANIAFIIGLLYVGLSILFQRSKSAIAKGFIIRLILMALLINFSLVIGQGVVAIADTVQSQFMPDDSQAVNTLAYKLMGQPIHDFKDATLTDENGKIATGLSVTDLIKPIVILALAQITVIVFLVMIILFFIRLVGIMMLYMLSPVAYIGYVFEEFSASTWKRWWNEFLKYAFMGPILVFFINIAAMFATTTSSQYGTLIGLDGSLSSTLVGNALTLVTHFIVIAVLLIGFKIALSASAGSSKKIVDKVAGYADKANKSILRNPFGFAKPAVNYGSDKLAETFKKRGHTGLANFITAAGNPKQTGKAWVDAQITQPKKDREDARAKRIAGLVGTKEKGTAMSKYSKISSEKGYKDEDTATLRDVLKKNLKEHNSEGAGAAMHELARRGKMEEILEGATDAGLNGGKKYDRDADGMIKALGDIQKQTGLSDKDAVAFGRFFDEKARAEKGQSHYAGVTTRVDGETKLRSLDVETEELALEAKNLYIENQVKARLKSSIADDLKNTSIDAMVKEVEVDGEKVKKFTDSQIAYMVSIGDNISDPKVREKFRQGPVEKLQTMVRVYNNGGSQELEEALTTRYGREDAQKYLRNFNNLFNGELPETTSNSTKKKNPIGFIRPEQKNDGKASSGSSRNGGSIDDITATSSGSTSSSTGSSNSSSSINTDASAEANSTIRRPEVRINPSETPHSQPMPGQDPTYNPNSNPDRYNIS